MFQQTADSVNTWHKSAPPEAFPTIAISTWVRCLKYKRLNPNNAIQSAQAIELNQTINGIIKNEDVDVYSFSAEKGQRISVEVEGIRLGYMFDPFIAILDENKFEIAISDDSALLRQDGYISITAPESGNYFVLVREASYGGDDNSRYRLHVGDFPRPAIAFPAGGMQGTETNVTYIGDAYGPIQQQIKLDDPAEGTGANRGRFVRDEHGVSPSPVTFRVSEVENFLEVEPNGKWKKLSDSKQKKIESLPIAFNGIIESAGDKDYFKFTAKKGQVFDFECFARRLRSGLDPVMNIFTDKHKSIIGNDDARNPDCYMRFTVPADGDYLLRIRDHLDRGQPDFVYRVEATIVKPSLSISIPRVDRYSQRRQQIVIPQGNRFATLINATRTNLGGQIKLLDKNLPSGVTVHSRPMAANLNLMPVVFEATDDAEIAGELFDLQAASFDPKQPEKESSIVGSFVNSAAFALGQPNNALYYACKVNRVPIAIVKPLPFKLDIVQPQVPLVRGGSMKLKITVTRDEGFKKPIRLQFPFRPPGVGTRPEVVIAEGKTEAFYPLNANGKAQLGNWPVYVIGRSEVQGPAWGSTQLADLEISEPIVSMAIKRSSCTRGSETSILCKLTHNREFTGEADAVIKGLPPGINIEPLTFTSETKELIFKVQTTEKCPFGKHKGLFCSTTITENGEPIVAVSGRSELQITKPKPEPAVAKNAAKQKNDTKKNAKPLSRLEKLREQARRGQTTGENK